MANDKIAYPNPTSLCIDIEFAPGEKTDLAVQHFPKLNQDRCNDQLGARLFRINRQCQGHIFVQYVGQRLTDLNRFNRSKQSGMLMQLDLKLLLDFS